MNENENESTGPSNGNGSEGGPIVGAIDVMNRLASGEIRSPEDLAGMIMAANRVGAQLPKGLLAAAQELQSRQQPTASTAPAATAKTAAQSNAPKIGELLNQLGNRILRKVHRSFPEDVTEHVDVVISSEGPGFRVTVIFRDNDGHPSGLSQVPADPTQVARPEQLGDAFMLALREAEPTLQKVLETLAEDSVDDDDE